MIGRDAQNNSVHMTIWIQSKFIQKTFKYDQDPQTVPLMSATIHKTHRTCNEFDGMESIRISQMSVIT